MREAVISDWDREIQEAKGTQANPDVWVWRARTELLIAEVRRLREALSEFGEHQCVLPRGCPKWAKPLDRDAVCTCGLDAALVGGR